MHIQTLLRVFPPSASLMYLTNDIPSTIMIMTWRAKEIGESKEEKK